MEAAALRKIAVVGFGTMGRGIAQAIAARGVNVLCLEKTEPRARETWAEFQRDLELEIGRWSLTDTERRAILARAEPCFDEKRLAECDLAIEAVDEEIGAKTNAFRSIDAHLPAGRAIFSNASAISITELASRVGRPELVAGTHFHHPAQRRPVVEIIRGLRTSDETVALARRLMAQLEKTCVEVFEYPGYITTRLIVPYLNEAMHIVMEGIASAEDVDTAARLGYDFPAGPLSMADRFGLDEVLDWMERLFADLGDVKYRPCPLLRKLVRAGRFGVKTRAGFFEYDENHRRVASTLPLPGAKMA